jgi:EAL domain-containing protein (putative c-di-GMP-specific phosphodiesterase class I)/DNA-binding NarL/FixJ family response regulator
MEAIRVMLADDEEQVLDVMSDLMSSDPRIDVVGRARDAREAIEVARAASPDVALVDVRMPGGGGPVATRGIRRDSPPTRIVAVSADTEPDVVLAMLDAGATGYVGKDEPVERILRAVHRAVAGETSISVPSVEEMAERLAERTGPGTSRGRTPAADRVARVIEDRALHVVYQPIVELIRGRIVGVEALARIDARPKNLPTETWFADAAAAGLLAELELLAIELALRDLDRLPAGTYLAVNLTAASVRAPSFAQLLSDVPADRVVLEVTEASPAGDDPELVERLRPLRDRGLRLSIDDVGAGYSSFARVLQLLPDYLKLDRSVVTGVAEDPLRRSLIQRLVGFSDDAAIAVVAEGVQTAEDLETLRQLYVPFGQGSHLGRPGPLPRPADDGSLRWPGRHAFHWRDRA